MKLKGTQTEINLARAYASECQARTRYEFIEYGARYNGYKNIADVIDEIVFQEFNHSRMFYTFIQDGNKNETIDNIDISAGFPFREKWDLMDNLRLASEDETKEAEMYVGFAKTAKKEGFLEIADLFLMIKDVEMYHQQIFNEMYTQMRDGTLYKKDNPVTWICADCGYMATGKEPWDECPLCKAKRGSVKLILAAKMLNQKIK
ncbi:MAG: rubrerythrin family protein [Clostridia bacterium]|nr:rubrerythrin family protein [Clostridia bacterium]